MSGRIVLRPGRVALAQWRAIYHGADFVLDWVARADVEAGAAALQRILARDGSPPWPKREAAAQPSGEALPASVVRLFLAIKLASLAGGGAGVRWQLVQHLAEAAVLPSPPEIRDGDGAAALEQIAGVPAGRHEAGMTGVLPLQKHLHDALELGPHEAAALLPGRTLAKALALAGLFEAERLFGSGLVAACLSQWPPGRSGSVPHPQAVRAAGLPGGTEVAEALRRLVAAGPADAGTSEGTVFPLMQMGAILDLLRQAGRVLERAANAAGEEKLVLWQSEVIVDAIDPAPALRLAEDAIALALREIGRLAHDNIVVLRGNPRRKTAASPQSMAEGFAAENRERALPRGVLPLPATPAGADENRRLLKMAGATTVLVALQLVAAARHGDGKASESDDIPLDRARRLVAQRLPRPGRGVRVAPADLAAAVDLVRSGALAESPLVPLPAVSTEPAAGLRRHLGAACKAS